MNIPAVMYDLIAVLSIFNFARILAMLLGADIYDVKQMINARKLKAAKPYQPLVSVLIPAYNEEVGVIRTLDSVLANSYENYEVIIIDDGSKDRTAQVVRDYIKSLDGTKIETYLGRRIRPSALERRYIRVDKNRTRVVVASQPNAGKGAALNNGVENYARGELVMVVDADSLLHPQAISRMVEHFRDEHILAAAANVKIIPSKTILGVAQRIEYLISYRMKRANTTLGMEYIVGGVGSTFRRKMLIEAGLYDTDTMTEDIDLTLKLIRLHGNKTSRVHYAADVITYTEHVLSFRSLIRQRFRWKYGRFQSLKKCRSLFFSRRADVSKQLAWYQLPYALFGEAVLLVEPILVAYIMFVAIKFTDITSLLWVYTIVSAFVLLMLSSEDSESWKAKVGLSVVLPAAYFLMYVLTAVEFMALLKSMRLTKQLFGGKFAHGSWEHVERSGKAVVVPN